MIANNGFDCFIYSIVFLLSYLVFLFFISKHVHYLGKYSLGDVIAARFPQNNLRFTMAVSTFIISIFYMIPLLVASGLLIRLLLFIDYSTFVLVIGSLMTIYVVFGCMMASL